MLTQQVHANPQNENLNSYNTSCVMHEVHAKASKTLRAVNSDHGLTITNTSGSPQTYHVEYLNYIQYTGSYYNINAKTIFDATLEDGETRNFPSSISKDANFSLKGTYSLQCRTVLSLNGKEVSSAYSKNYAYIE